MSFSDPVNRCIYLFSYNRKYSMDKIRELELNIYNHLMKVILFSQSQLPSVKPGLVKAQV